MKSAQADQAVFVMCSCQPAFLSFLVLPANAVIACFAHHNANNVNQRDHTTVGTEVTLFKIAASPASFGLSIAAKLSHNGPNTD
jgi:hypothetical protein